jgi:hypothetical protein
MALPAFLTASAWKVVTRPVLYLGGALLAAGALAMTIGPTCPLTTGCPSAAMTSYRLALQSESDPACYYGSAWNDGDVVLAHDGSDGRTITLTNRYDFEDGCTWEATELLTPNGGSGYAYSYSERVVGCRVGATPAIACARSGSVSTTPAD